MPLRVAVTLLLLVIHAAAFAQSGTAVLNSPDGRLAITFQTVEMSKPGPRGGRTAPTQPNRTCWRPACLFGGVSRQAAHPVFDSRIGAAGAAAVSD